MKNFFKLFLFACAIVLFNACNTQKATEEKTVEDTSKENKVITRQSADNLDSLTAILIRSLAAKDKYLYMSYCFTEDQEKQTAEIITDRAKKRRFKREFGFSLHEEVAYFENLCKYIDKVGIDLTKVEAKFIESFDYNKIDYTPLVVKEVVIPIIQEGLERDIVYVGIQLNNRWYFTSELSL